MKYYKANKLEYPPQLKEKLEGSFAFLDTDLKVDKKEEAANQKPVDATYHRFDEQVAISLEPLDNLSVSSRNIQTLMSLLFSLKF